MSRYLGKHGWLFAAVFLLGTLGARADVWTGVSNHEVDFSSHRDTLPPITTTAMSPSSNHEVDFSSHRDSFHDILLRQMRRDLSAYLDKHQDQPSVRRFAEEDRELILEHLESEVKRATLALLSEYSMQVTAGTRATPKGDSFMIEDHTTR